MLNFLKFSNPLKKSTPHTPDLDNNSELIISNTNTDIENSTLTIESISPDTINSEPNSNLNHSTYSWLSRLKKGLSRTSTQLAVALGVGVVVDDALYEELETALLQADCGMPATTALLKALRLEVNHTKADTVEKVRECLAIVLERHLQPLQTIWDWRNFKPCVLLIVGVNGAGKTTSIGKLAYWFSKEKANVLLAAGDTFRAAAREQLAVWGDRNGISMLQQHSKDPSAIVFDAITAAKARHADILLADTAGRLPTQLHLMEELKKIKRTASKAINNLPYEIWLILDGNTGQNAIAQAKSFHEAIGLTGLVVTKLDGTAKGGMLAALASVCPVPVRFIGIGEQLNDLQPFNAKQFARSLIGIN